MRLNEYGGTQEAPKIWWPPIIPANDQIEHNNREDEVWIKENKDFESLDSISTQNNAVQLSPIRVLQSGMRKLVDGYAEGYAESQLQLNPEISI